MRGALSQHTCGRPVFYAFSLGIGEANNERRSDNRRGLDSRAANQSRETRRRVRDKKGNLLLTWFLCMQV